MAQPTVTVKVAFATDPGDASPSWTDISAFVLNEGLQIRRGRQRELDQAEAGVASFTLLNTDRRFDPDNAGSLVNLISNPRFATVDGSVEVLADVPSWYARFGEASGTTFTDSSGYGHNGTYSGGPSLGQTGWLTGDSNTAALFDGVDDYAAVPDSVAIGASFVWEIAAKSVGANWSNYAFLGSYRGANGFIAHCNSGAKSIDFYVYNNAGSPGLVGSYTPAAINVWHLYAFGYDNATGAWKIVMDGDVVASGVQSVGARSADTIPLEVGRDYGNAARNGNAYLDEAALYPSYLPANRLRAHYQAPTGWKTLDANDSLVATRSSTLAKYGADALKLVNANGGEDDYEYFQVTGLAASTAYTISAYVNCTAFTQAATSNRGLFAYDLDNVSTQQATTLTAATAGWVRHQVTVTTTATGGTHTIEIRLYGPKGTVYWDGVQLEAGSAATEYVDGAESDGRWSGTANASASYRGGPYYPNVVPLRRCRISAIHNAVTYPLFDGYIERWPQVWETTGKVAARVEAVDGFELLQTFFLDTDPATYTTPFTSTSPTSGPTVCTISNASPAVVTAAAHGRSANDKIRFQTSGTLPTGLSTGVDYFVLAAGLTSGAFRVAATPGGTAINTSSAGSGVHGFFYYAADNTKNLIFTSKPGIYGNTISVTFTVTEDPGNNDAGVYLDTASVAEEQQIILRIPIDPVSLDPYPITAAYALQRIQEEASVMALVDVELAGDGSGAITTAEKTYLSGGTYTPEASGTRIGNVLDDASWPAGLRDLDAGDVNVDYAAFGPRDEVTALQHVQDANAAEHGLFFMTAGGTATFQARDARLSSPYTTSAGTVGPDYIPYQAITPEYSKDSIYNIVSVARQKGEKQEVSDAASILKFRPRMLRLAPAYLASDADALTLATSLLAAYKDPQLRFEQVTVSPGDSTTAFAFALSREISDRITVNYQPGDVGTDVFQDEHIESIAVEFDGTAWWFTWQLSPAA